VKKKKIKSGDQNPLKKNGTAPHSYFSGGDIEKPYE